MCSCVICVSWLSLRRRAGAGFPLSSFNLFLRPHTLEKFFEVNSDFHVEKVPLGEPLWLSGKVVKMQK
jgi:hypothetical protein